MCTTKTMSVHLNTENIQTTISQLNRDFAGRPKTDDYDETKLVHIHRRNRPFVWSDDMQNRLLDSILKGYYIPPIICSSRIMNNRDLREVMEGGNRITTFRKILNGTLRKVDGTLRQLSDVERQRVEAFPITLVVMRGLSSKDQRVMFRRLNKNVRVSDGQLYSMSEEDSPLVQEAIALLNEDDHPLRDEITKHFFDTRGTDGDKKSHLENAVALISGALNGVEFITKSYNIQEDKIELQTPISRDLIIQRLRPLFHIFDIADERHPLPDKRKRRGQWSVGKWLGAMLYDLLSNQDECPRIQEKWANYMVAVRRNEEGAEEAYKIGGAQNLTSARYKKICNKVDIYLKDHRLATDDELNASIHSQEDDEFSEQSYEDDLDF
jgi:hypothetical protein